jgi:IS30 family transposase
VDSEQAGAVKVLTRMYQALIWEQGVEMRDWKQVRMASDVTNLVLRARVELDLEKKYSPEQIAGRLDNTLAGLGGLARS